MAFEVGYKSISGQITGISQHIVLNTPEVVSQENNCIIIYTYPIDIALTHPFDTLSDGVVCDFGDELKIRYGYFGDMYIKCVHGDEELLQYQYGSLPDLHSWGLVDFTYNGITYCGLAVFDRMTKTNGYIIGFDTQFYGIEKQGGSDDYGPYSRPDGYEGGTFDDSSDEIPLPDTPAIGITDVGFVNLYEVSTGALQSLGEDLFPELEPIDPTTGAFEALTSIGYNIAQLLVSYQNAQLIPYIIDCHILPVKPTTGVAAGIKIGYKTFEQQGNVVTSDYVDIDCGTLNIGEYYASFLDYSSNVKLFLPFIGFVDVKNEWFQSGLLNVYYRFNVVDGSFMAFVRATSSKSNLTNSVVAQYGGNACVHIPVTGSNYSSLTSGLVNAASAPVVGGKGIVSADTANTAMSLLGDMAGSPAGSNGYNCTTSFLGVRTPYLLIERIAANFAENYPEEHGLPDNVYHSNFSNVRGFTTATDLHLDGLTCLDAEKDLIANAFKNGIIF